MAEIRYFFSYAREDTEFVLKLAQELRSVGANVWVDQLDILGGQRWDSAVEAALEVCEGMIIVLSPHSVASHNVLDEVSYALEKEKPIVPVLFQPCNIPFRLRRLQHVDFTSNYDTGFTRLLRALHVEMPPETHAIEVPTEPLIETSTAANVEPTLLPVEEPLPDRQMAQGEVLIKPLIEDAEPTSVEPPLKQSTLRLLVAQVFTELLTVLRGSITKIRRDPTLIKQRFMALHPRLRSALIGLVIGAIWGGDVTSTFNSIINATATEFFRVFLGIAGAIIGAIIGKDWRVFLVTVVGIVIGSALWLLIDTSINIRDFRTALFGVPLGALVGALVGVTLKKWRGWT